MDSVGMYVDVENLKDVAKEAISNALSQWPKELPQPNMLRLYVRADQAEMWRFWASHRYPHLDIQIAPVQHYSLNDSKNSADIALSLDAITDLLKNRVTHVAVLSDDSDFAILFSKITREMAKANDGKFPFTWFLTDRTETRSSVLDGFLPEHCVRTVVCAEKKHTAPKTQPQPKPTHDKDQNTLIAETIIKHIKVGSFKSTDCAKVIKKYSPNHPSAKMEPAKFGTYFSEKLWPTLEQYGVRLTNLKSPKKYEMTEEAKQKVSASQE